MGNKARLTFRITVWRPWLLAVAMAGLVAAVLLAVNALTGTVAAAVPVLLVLAGGAVVLLLPIGWAVWVSRWQAGPHGVGGPNNWLAYRHLDWSEIDSVEPWLIPGYRYLQVNGAGERWAFWLPLFLTNMEGFRAAVLRYAPPENPLRRYLEKHPD